MNKFPNKWKGRQYKVQMYGHSNLEHIFLDLIWTYQSNPKYVPIVHYIYYANVPVLKILKDMKWF